MAVNILGLEKKEMPHNIHTHTRTTSTMPAVTAAAAAAAALGNGICGGRGAIGYFCVCATVLFALLRVDMYFGV